MCLRAVTAVVGAARSPWHAGLCGRSGTMKGEKSVLCHSCGSVLTLGPVTLKLLRLGLETFMGTEKKLKQ